MLTQIKQPAAAPAAAPAFEPSHHIGEAAAIVSEDEKIETIRTLRSENRGLQRKVEAQKLTLTLTLTLTLALTLTRWMAAPSCWSGSVRSPCCRVTGREGTGAGCSRPSTPTPGHRGRCR